MSDIQYGNMCTQNSKMAFHDEAILVLGSTISIGSPDSIRCPRPSTGLSMTEEAEFHYSVFKRAGAKLRWFLPCNVAHLVLSFLY